LKAIFVAYFYAKQQTIMQSEQLNYIPILMQLLLAVGFVAGTIFVSGKLGPKRTSETKDKNFE
jgi:NADH-quinone oxidoreductase subunit A